MGQKPGKELYMGEGFVVESSYQGYVFLGWAAGKFETERKEKRPYYNMFVLSPVSDYSLENYEARDTRRRKRNASAWRCGRA